MPKVNKVRKYAKKLREEIDADYARWKKTNRSYKKITKDDLLRLRKIAIDYQKELCKKRVKYKSLERLCICLCQGAGKHYIDGTTGVRDFDVYTFYKKNGVNYPYRNVVIRDFQDNKFGTTDGYSEKVQNKLKDFTGRKVDIMGRQISVNKNETFKASVERYLSTEPTETAHFLAKKGVVVLDPLDNLGDILWPRK